MTKQYSDAMPGAILPQQWFTADDTTQLGRLGRFRASHEDVSIRQAEFGAGWEAEVPLPRNGRGYYAPVDRQGTPRSLRDLLDVLEEELAEPDG